jgi:hypothetical protein
MPARSGNDTGKVCRFRQVTALLRPLAAHSEINEENPVMLKQKSSAYRGYRTPGSACGKMLPQLARFMAAHEAFLPAVTLSTRRMR